MVAPHAHPLAARQNSTVGKFICAFSALLAASALVLLTSPHCPAQLLSVDVPASLGPIRAGRVPRNVEQLKQLEEQLQRLAEIIAQCTVGVQVGSAHGSGVIVSAEGHVLTAAHVALHPGLKAEIRFSDGRLRLGTTRGMDLDMDAGMIKIDADEELPHLKMAQATKIRDGQWCLAAGHPGGHDLQRGTVLRVGRIIDIDDFVRSDCPIVGGDSGGPLVNLAGEVIAIHSRIGSNLSNNQHVPIGRYHKSWDRLVSGEIFPLQAFIGVTGDRNRAEAVVVSVYDESPAEMAGIQVDDVIMSANGEKINRFADLQEFVKAMNPGDKVKFVLLRGTETIEATLHLGQRLVRNNL